MDNAQDFGWSAAKGAHRVFLCRMEENKVEWHQTRHIERIRRSDAQKVATQSQGNTSKEVRNEPQDQPCRFFQSKSCPHKGDHVTGTHNLCHMYRFRKKITPPSL